MLLELAGRLGPGELTERLRYWLSMAADAVDNARLVAGLFALHRATLVRNQAVIGAVTDFLLGLELDQLTPLLPVLRRGLGRLSGPERGYLSETLGSILGLELAGRAGRWRWRRPTASGCTRPTRRWRRLSPIGRHGMASGPDGVLSPTALDTAAPPRRRGGDPLQAAPVIDPATLELGVR